MKRIRGWAFDILVGWVMGSIPLGIACGVVGAFVGAEVAFSAAGVLMGTILGIVFMRRRRWLRAEEAGGGTEPVDEAQNSRTWSWLRVVAVALGVCLVGGLIASNVLLWLRAEDARNDLRDVRRDAANTAALARTGCDDSFGFGSASPAVCDELATVQSDVADVQGTAGDAQSAAEDARSNVADVQGQVDDMRDCVNAYMDTIATSSNNVESRYTYRPC